LCLKKEKKKLIFIHEIIVNLTLDNKIGAYPQTIVKGKHEEEEDDDDRKSFSIHTDSSDNDNFPDIPVYLMNNNKKLSQIAQNGDKQNPSGNNRKNN
jgi:hypothetical protein